jgi:superkiller protein 3
MRHLVAIIVVCLVFAASVVAAAPAEGEGGGLRAQAEHYFLKGKWRKAAEAYGKLVREEPALEDLYRLAEAHMYSYYFDDAREVFEKVLSIKEDDPYAAISLAMLKALRKKKTKGFKELRALSDKYGGDYRYWRAVGFAFFQKDQDRQAIKALKKAVKLNPRDYMSYFFMGLAYELHLDFDNAMKPYKKAVAINPIYAQAVNNLGYNYKERHYYTYAARMYEKAIELDPEHPGYYYNLGNVYNHWKMRREAFYMHSRAAELEPEFSKAHYNVGRNYVRFGFYEEGIRHLKLYIKYWRPNLSERDVPNPKVVKKMIKDVKAMMEDREEGIKEVETERKRLEELEKTE